MLHACFVPMSRYKCIAVNSHANTVEMYMNRKYVEMHTVYFIPLYHIPVLCVIT